jgi:hypothetical protein
MLAGGVQSVGRYACTVPGRKYGSVANSYVNVSPAFRIGRALDGEATTQNIASRIGFMFFDMFHSS